MKLKLFILMLFFSFSCLAQEEEILKIFDTYYEVSSTDYEYGLKLMKKAYYKSNKIKKDSLKSRSANNLAKKFLELKQLDSARVYAFIAKSSAEKVKFYKVIAAAYNSLGLIEEEQSNYTMSLNYYLKGIKIAEKYKEHQFLSAIYGNIADLYEIQKNKDKALQYYLLNLKLAAQLKDDYLFYTAYESLGAFYIDHKKALFYFKKALEKALILKDPTLIFNSNCNLSVYYIDNKLLKKAKYHLDEALKIANEKNDSTMLFFVNYNLGGYWTEKDLTIANQYYEKTKSYMTAAIPLNKHIEFYSSYSKNFIKLKNFEKGLFYAEKHHQLKDSLFSLDQKKQFETIQTVYEVEKKNNNIKQLTKQKEIETKNKWLIFWISFSIILLGLIVFFIFYFKKKNQALKAHQEKLNLIKDKELEHVKGVLEGTNVERNRLAKELHDNVAHSLLIIKHQIHLKKINETDLDNKVSEIYQDIRNISHNLSSNYLIDKNLDDLITGLLNQIKNDFNFETELVVFPKDAVHNLSDFIKEHLYRIFQELFQNIQKHALATHISVNITKIGNLLTFIIEDNGLGFKIENKDFKKNGIGLKNIEERLQLIQGKLEKDYNDNGTTLILTIEI